MAQVGSIHLVGASDTSKPKAEPGQSQQADPEITPTTCDQLSAEKACRETQSEEVENPESGLLIDSEDEVQFVFSAPRRRKKKRRRLDQMNQPSSLSRSSIFPAESHSRPEQGLPKYAMPSGGGDAVQVYFSDAGGLAKNTTFSHLPPVSSSRIIVPDADVPCVRNSISGSTSAPQTPSMPSAAAGWNVSTSTAQLRSDPYMWRIATRNKVNQLHKKVFQNGSGMPIPSFHDRNSDQISPRTNPPATASQPPACSNGPNAASFVESDIFHPYKNSISGQAVTHSWSNSGLSPFDNTKKGQYVSPYREAKSPSIVEYPSGIFENSPASQKGIFRLNTGHAPSTTNRPIRDLSRSSQVRKLSPQNQPMVQRNSYVPSPSPWKPSQSTVPVQELDNVAMQNQIASTNSPPSTYQKGKTPSSDIMRKPSLYTIPPWPSSQNPSIVEHPEVVTQPLLQAHHLKLKGNSFNLRAQCASNAASNIRALPPDMNADLLQAPCEKTSRGSDLATISPSRSSSSQVPPQLTFGTQEPRVPQTRGGRKHSPNLIVDIAETCQELFPFAVVAERHNIPITKVFDTFSAIIQLPLLRNADDRRRHGSLGKKRIREYREAKQAMEKAQEAERKAQMKAMRARVEEARKQGNFQSKPPGLLKVAILNNAREIQGGGMS